MFCLPKLTKFYSLHLLCLSQKEVKPKMKLKEGGKMAQKCNTTMLKIMMMIIEKRKEKNNQKEKDKKNKKR